MPILAAVFISVATFAVGFFSANIFSTKPFSCYLSFERPCYEKQVPSRKIIEMGSRAGEKSFSVCVKDPSAIQGTTKETSEKCNQKLYQFDIPYDEEIKYCSSKSSILRKYEGNCIPPIIIPSILALNPASGSVGTRITISGNGFTPTNNYLVLGSPLGPVYIPISLSSPDGRIIMFTVPSMASLLTSCSPLEMGDSASCNGEPLKKVAITPGEYSVMIVNANGFQTYSGDLGKFTVTTISQ